MTSDRGASDAWAPDPDVRALAAADPGVALSPAVEWVMGKKRLLLVLLVLLTGCADRMRSRFDAVPGHGNSHGVAASNRGAIRDANGDANGNGHADGHRYTDARPHFHSGSGGVLQSSDSGGPGRAVDVRV